MTKWLQLRGSQSAETSAEPHIDSKIFSSLALNVLFHQLRPGHKYNILDLGPAFGANVEFFSQFSCKIYIEDLYRTLNSFDFFSPEDGFSYDAIFEYLLPYKKSTRFDIVLAWDLLNYLERDEFLYLMRHVTKFCRSGTLLFALISIQKHIPEKPINFKIVDNESLIYESCPAVLRPGPQYQQTDLAQLMPNFRVFNSFLLRHGIKEYLFVCE